MFSCCARHLTLIFQVWEIEPNGTWKVKWDPATHSEPSLSSSQNLAEPQSFTWFWVKTTLNHLFSIHGFSLKMRFHAKSAPVSEVLLGRAWAHLELMWTLLHQHPRSASMGGLLGMPLKIQAWATLLMQCSTRLKQQPWKQEAPLISPSLCSWIFQEQQQNGRQWTRTREELVLKVPQSQGSKEDLCSNS